MSDRVLKVLEHGDAEEASDKQLALEIGDVLQKVYPNHPWIVGFQSGGIVIRHLSIASEVERVIGRPGFSSLLPKDIRTPDQIRAAVVEFAGQLLELFGLPRGPWDGRLPIVPDWSHKKGDNFT